VTHQWLKISAVIVTIVLFGGVRAAWAGFVFLKNTKNDTAQGNREELKDLYTGRKKGWKNGTEAAIVLNAPGTPELSWIADQLIGASEDILLAKIKQEVFKGEMKKPATAASAQECIAAVQKIPGAVCVVDAGAAKGLPDGVAVLPYQAK
jgi:ABC-type phosphate transport system substrate-binding protein